MSTQGIRAGRAYVELGVADKLDAGLKRAQAKLNAFSASTMKIGASISAAGAAITAPVVGAAVAFAKTGDQLDKMSKRTGMTVENLSALSFAAERSGASIESVEKSSRKLSQNITDLAQGGKAATEMFTNLGLSAADLVGKSPDEALDLVMDRLSKIEDPAARAAAAIDVFGRSGTELLPMLANGVAGIEELRAEARRLNLVMSGEDAEAAAILNDALGDVWATIKGLTISIGAAIAGPMTSVVQTIANIISIAIEWAKNNRALIQTVAAVGVGLVAAGTALVGIGLAAGAIAAGISAVVSAIGLIFNPITLVIAAIAGIVVAIQMMTGVFDPAIEAISDGFTWLSDLVGKTMGGISDALYAGELGLAAQIAVTAMKLAFATGLEAILELFGLNAKGIAAGIDVLIDYVIGSIQTMLAGIKAMMSKVTSLLRSVGMQTMAVTIDATMAGATVALGSMKGKGLALGIANSLDTGAIQAELDALVNQSAELAKVVEEQTKQNKRQGFDPVDIDPITAVATAADSMPKSFGSFSASAVNRAAAGGKEQEKIVKNTAETTETLKEIARILPTIAMRFV